jgi:leucyl-tRNA synthetase
MSKSTGNFLTSRQAVEKFSADAARLAMVNAGDGIEDANFEETVANRGILKLHELKEWCEDVIGNSHPVSSAEECIQARDGNKTQNLDTIQRFGELGFWDQLFENEVNTLIHKAKTHYAKLVLSYFFPTARCSYLLFY